VPVTTFDEEKKLAYLQIDIDEGKLFYVAEVRIAGVDEATRQKLSRELAIKSGDIYNGRLFQLSRERIRTLFRMCECNDSEKLRLDFKTGTVVVNLDFSPCS